MELKLLHIYGDVMNLYGEYANMEVLSRFLREAGHTVSVTNLSLYDTFDIADFDFYYMGAGTERKQKLALSELMKYRAALKTAFDAGKPMLFTGNAFELLGKSVTDAEGREFEALGLADFTTVETNRRITGDVLADMDGENEPIVGFMNKCSRTVGVTAPLFRITMGFGNEKTCGDEGWHEKNCYGTHLTAPLLAKNPMLLKRFARLLLGEAYRELPCNEYMQRGYETTRSELVKRRDAVK